MNCDAGGLFNTNKQSSSKICNGFQGGHFIQFAEIGAVFSRNTNLGGTRTTSPFAIYIRSLIRPLFTRTSPLRRMR